VADTRVTVPHPAATSTRVLKPETFLGFALIDSAAMRSSVAPFVWLMVAAVFAVVWHGQKKSVYLAIAVVFAILAVGSYIATKK
jgi:hypothetical protein